MERFSPLTPLTFLHIPLSVIYILKLNSWFLIGLLIDVILTARFKRTQRIHD